MKKVGILGATGYTGQELLNILTKHTKIEINFLSSRTYAGQIISDVFPNLRGRCDVEIEHPDNLKNHKLDILFCALPHKKSAEFIKDIYDDVPLIIDLSADFRLDDVNDYPIWYDMVHPAQDLLAKKVFGLVEIYRDKIKNAKLIANPGCYPTSVNLGVAPALTLGMLGDETVIVDSKSSISGAGRSLKYGNLFVEMNENMYPYSAGHKHRHISEMEQEGRKFSKNKDYNVIFTPHVIPINRGILSNIYITLNKDLSKEEILEIYKDFYKDDYFVRVLDTYPQIAGVRYSNYCDIGIEKVGNGRYLIMSAIDNIVKGASGQAVQNMNVALGYDETEGLI